MQIQKNVNLKPYTAFKIGGAAEYFCRVKTQADLKRALAFTKAKKLKVLVISGGSNLLVSNKAVDGLVILLKNRGVSASKKNTSVIIKAAAGENWDKLVQLAVSRVWWGMENLSHIPGSVGAVAVQNVGAYGQEASQIIRRVKVFDIQKSVFKIFTARQCKFGYRQSIFNSKSKGRFVIWEIEFRLKANGQPNLAYADVSAYFKKTGLKKPNLRQIRRAIIKIRDRKFTMPGIIPNAGSFFKNLQLNYKGYLDLDKLLRQKFGSPELNTKLAAIRSRSKLRQGVKFPAALLIDLCGLKGFKLGGAKINETQPLVILNFAGKATAADVLNLMKRVRKTIYAQTGKILVPEPELVGFSKEELEQVFSL